LKKGSLATHWFSSTSRKISRAATATARLCSGWAGPAVKAMSSSMVETTAMPTP